MKSKIKDSKKLNLPGNRSCVSNREILTASLKRWWQKLGYVSIFTALPTVMASLGQQARAEETNITPASDSGQNVKLLERLNRRGGKPKFWQYGNNYPLPFEKGQTDIISNLTGGGDDCPGNPITAGFYTAANPFTDSGDTTGANNTVNSVYCYYCNGLAAGPDQIYSFTLTGVGANPRIEVTASSAGYSPTIYILNSQWSPGCPGGTNNTVFNNFYDPARANAEGTAVYDSSTLSYLPLNEPFYLFVDAQNADSFGSYTLRMRDVSIATAPSPQKPFDFDGDGKADISVFRPSDQTWYVNGSSQGVSSTRFGLSTDKLAPAHFDGDGKTDLTVYRNGTWYRLNSNDNTLSVVQFGLPNDIPVPGNYGGNDSRSELAVYRGGVWWIYVSEWQYADSVLFGLESDKPVPADYNGDGYTDLAVYRDGVWWIRDSDSSQIRTIQFGLPGDKPVPADYDGDGKADLAVYRGNGEWHILGSLQGYFVVQWGISTDTPVPADYDGDGRTDAAVFRDGTWWIRQSANGIAIQQFGLAGDKPVPAAFLP